MCSPRYITKQIPYMVAITTHRFQVSSSAWPTYKKMAYAQLEHTSQRSSRYQGHQLDPLDEDVV